MTNLLLLLSSCRFHLPDRHHNNRGGRLTLEVQYSVPVTYWYQPGVVCRVPHSMKAACGASSQQDTRHKHADGHPERLLKGYRRPLPTVPLTREALQQHTRRWEEECRETWSRRLKRMSNDMLPEHPLAKQARPSTSSTPPVHWSQAQREEFYRSLAPNPPPPPGKNFQVETFQF